MQDQGVSRTVSSEAVTDSASGSWWFAWISLEKHLAMSAFKFTCIPLCVCVCERERKRERVSVCVRVHTVTLFLGHQSYWIQSPLYSSITSS